MEKLDVKHLIRQHWGERACEFDAVPHHGLHSSDQYLAWFRLLMRLAGCDRLSVLDIGCGTGFLSLLLAEIGHDVVGVDLAPAMLEQARQKAEQRGLRARFCEGDAESLQFFDAQFDLVVERHLIWTLPNPEKAVREWARVIKPGGRIALFEGDWGQRSESESAYQQIRSHLPFYGGQPSNRLVEFLAALGLHDIKTEPLMSESLWGEISLHERYLMVGHK